MFDKKIFSISSLTMCLVFVTLSVQAGSLHIMLTNDDGIDAPGIKTVEKALIHSRHRVSVVAQYNHIDPQMADSDAELLEQGYITISFLKSNLAVSDKARKNYTKTLKRTLKLSSKGATE